MDIEEARRRLAANPPKGDPTAEPGETLAEKAARLDDAERARVAAEFGVRPDQITLRGCGGERGEEWG